MDVDVGRHVGVVVDQGVDHFAAESAREPGRDAVIGEGDGVRPAVGAFVGDEEEPGFGRDPGGSGHWANAGARAPSTAAAGSTRRR